MCNPALGTAQETQHHPASVDLELVKRLLAATKAPTLRAFLTREFCNISDDYARAAAPACPYDSMCYYPTKQSYNLFCGIGTAYLGPWYLPMHPQYVVDCLNTYAQKIYKNMFEVSNKTCSESLQTCAQPHALECGRAADQRDAGRRGCQHKPAHCERLAGDAPAPDPARGQVCGPLGQPLEPRRCAGGIVSISGWIF